MGKSKKLFMEEKQWYELMNDSLSDEELDALAEYQPPKEHNLSVDNISGCCDTILPHDKVIVQNNRKSSDDTLKRLLENLKDICDGK